MRKLVLVLLAVLVAVPASAQTLDKPTRVSFFVSNLAFGWSEGSGSFFESGFGVALERRFSRRWSAEVSVATEEHDIQPSFFNPTVYHVRTYPIDAVVRYSFLDVHTQWRPYVGGGVRYVSAPEDVPFEYEDQLSPEIAAGVEFNGGESWSLTAGAKHAIGDEKIYDHAFKIAIGFGWRF